MHDFERAVVRIKGLDPLTTELVRLRCARIHDCRRCRSVRDDAALEAGFDEELGAKIDDCEASDLAPRHKAALRLADAMILGTRPTATTPARTSARPSSPSCCSTSSSGACQKALVALRIEPAPAKTASPGWPPAPTSVYRF